MTTALPALDVVAGVAIVEWLRIALSRLGLKARLARVELTLRAFRSAQDDDARQALILQAGWHTLSVSLLMLGVLAFACALASLPWWWTTPTAVETAIHMTVLSLAALAWWRLRRTRA